MKEKWIVEFYLVVTKDNTFNIKGEVSNRFLIHDTEGNHYFESEAHAKTVLEEWLLKRAGENDLPRVFEIRKVYIK